MKRSDLNMSVQKSINLKNYITGLAGVTLEKQSTAETGYASTYVLRQGGTALTPKINIPKDFLVRSATLETCTTADVPEQGYQVGDKYIDFVINTLDSSETAQHIYLNVKDLVSQDTQWGTFTELQTLINNANSGDVIVLTKNYKRTNSESGLNLNGKELMFVGNDCILDGNGVQDIILYGIRLDNCCFEGVHFINFLHYAISIYSGCKVINCTFQGQTTTTYCLNITSSCNVILNCTFMGTSRGIYTTLKDNTIKNCIFLIGSINGIECSQGGMVVYNCTLNGAGLIGAVNKNYVSEELLDTVTVTVTYTDDTTETVTLYKQPSS